MDGSEVLAKIGGDVGPVCPPSGPRMTLWRKLAAGVC